MNLKDHFHEPLVTTHPWESIHGFWSVEIAKDLNRILPPGLRAFPQNRRGSSLEIDVATVELAAASVGSGGWQPEAPAWSVDVHLPELDLFEIRILEQPSSKLVGAIEIVSPANKDRPLSRQMFAGKCAGYLRMGIGVIVIDVVTSRQQNLHDLILELVELEHTPPKSNFADGDLYTVAYRTYWEETDPTNAIRLAVWPHLLNIGGNLPTLPLWLKGTFAVPVDLATSYAAVCDSLLIR